MATDYRDAHGSSWSEKWRKGWLRKLELYAFLTIGKLSADQIETKHLIKALQPLWSTKTRTADEVRGQIEQILDAARAHGLRAGENPARWRGHLENLLSRHEKKKARKREHHPALKWQDLPKLMETLRKDPSHVSVATQLLILTGARSHMVRFARWGEFDLEAGRWSLPDERMKSRQAFEIPLAPEAVSLLKNLPKLGRESPYTFPGRGRSGVMHANGIRDLLHGLGYENITRHGFRSTFRDWALLASRSALSLATIELMWCLHISGAENDQAFRHGAIFKGGAHRFKCHPAAPHQASTDGADPHTAALATR